MEATGFQLGQPSSGHLHKAGSNLPRNRYLVQPAGEDGWRFMGKCLSGNEVVGVAAATPCFGSARTAIADSVIAAWRAAPPPAWGNGVAPTAGTSRARKADSI